MVSSRGFRASCLSCLLSLAVVGGTACSSTLANRSAAAAPGARRALDVTRRSIGVNALQSQGSRPLSDVIEYFWPDVESPPWAMQASPAVRGADRLGVYANGASIGSLSALRDVTASRIASVRRLSPVEEQHEFGQMHAAGAVVVEWSKTPRR